MIFARNRLQESRPQTEGVLEHLCRIEKMLEPACRDTVTAAKELRVVVRELKRLPIRPATGRGFHALFQDPTALPGVIDSIAMLASAAAALEREHV